MLGSGRWLGWVFLKSTTTSFVLSTLRDRLLFLRQTTSRPTSSLYAQHTLLGGSSAQCDGVRASADDLCKSKKAFSPGVQPQSV